MAATHRVSSFTITQPFLGAPLQFQPALGSQELEELIDAYVVGPASKQDKLSEVTIDFYNRATVDITNGSLVRRYDVIIPSQSPTQSQSSGFSPIYTPSPSSSATCCESRNGSCRTPGRSRVSKKPAKKETKKVAEFKLPGFSIMTKDGVDVTSSAGRGTKTKEQREHAHMMRIMKACEECKKKKVRCDPSHKRSNNGSSAASTSTPNTKNSSPAPQNYSPASVGPPLSREFAPAPNAGDFILFPEDSSAWTGANASPSELDNQTYDLSNFDFEIGDIDMDEFTTLNEDDAFDWSFTQSSYPVERDPSYKPLIGDPYNAELWAGFEHLHTSSASYSDSASLEDFERLDSKSYMRSSQGVTISERSRAAATSPSPDYFAEFPELTFSSDSSSLGESSGSISSSSSALSLSQIPSDASNSQLSQTGVLSPGGAQLAEAGHRQTCTKKRLYSQTASAGEPSLYEASLSWALGETSDAGALQAESLSTNASQFSEGTPRGGSKKRQSIQTVQASPDGNAISAAPVDRLASNPASRQSLIDISLPLELEAAVCDDVPKRFRERNSGQLLQVSTHEGSLEPAIQARDQLVLQTTSSHDPRLLRKTSDRIQLLTIEHGCSTIAIAIRELTSAPLDEYLSLLGDLEQVRQGLDTLQRGYPRSRNSGRPPLSAVTIDGVASQLQALAARVTTMLNSELLKPVPDNRLDLEGRLEQRQRQVNTRRLVRSLCATISTLQVLSAESPTTRKSRVLTSRHNEQLVVSPEDRASYGARLTANLSQLDVTALPVHDLLVVADPTPAPHRGLQASELNIVEMISCDRSWPARATRTGQLETASLGFSLPLMILAGLMAASMANPSTIVLLGVQIIIGVAAACIIWPGNGLLACATATLLNHSPAPSIFSGTTISPTSSLLTVAASLLPLSTGSSRGPVSSSRRSSSKLSPSIDASHLFGALRRISVA